MTTGEALLVRPGPTAGAGSPGATCLPQQARAVILGGGTAGTSVAEHLAASGLASQTSAELARTT
jgi:hypothetical protein